MGVDVTVFASGDSAPQGGRLIPYLDEALRLKKIPAQDAAPYHLKALADVARWAHSDAFDIIHNHDDYWLLPLSDMISAPVLHTLHGRMDLPDIDQAFCSYPHNYFVSISDSQRRPMPQLRWVRTIHHGLDFSSFRFQPKPGEYLAFLGRITVEKRPEWAIQIAKRAGVPLKIAAKIEGRQSQDYFDALVRPHLDGKNIEYVGEISELEKSEFLGNALGLVFPIDWPEPFGLVVVEALACGTPVLARPCGAMPELLEPGVTGFCSWDINVLSEKVADLKSIDRRRCREWVETHFSLKRMTEDYINVYRQLTGIAQTKSYRHRRDILHSVERFADGHSQAQR